MEPFLPSVIHSEQDSVDLSLNELSDLPRPPHIPPLPAQPLNPILSHLQAKRRDDDDAPDVRPSLGGMQHAPPDTDLLPIALNHSLGILHGSTFGQLAQSSGVSWDTKTSPAFIVGSPSCWSLSEQSCLQVSLLQSRMQSAHLDHAVTIRYTTPEDLVVHLRLLLNGLSSSLYIWDADASQFVLTGINTRSRGVVQIRDTLQVVPSSVLDGFARIGTAIHRVRHFVSQAHHSSQHPVLHSFTYATASALDFLAESLSQSSLWSEQSPSAIVEDLISLSFAYVDRRDVAEQLSELCEKAMVLSDSISSPHKAAVALLSYLYDRVDECFSTRTPQHLTAQVAFLLTVSSVPYFRDVGASIGYYAENALSSGLPEQSKHREHPSFFSKQMAEEIWSAQQSVAFLQIANPEHPLLRVKHALSVQWHWSLSSPIQPDSGPISPLMSSTSRIQQPAYVRELRGLSSFDSVPITVHAQTRLPWRLGDEYRRFSKDFPRSLPPSLPTLDNLSTVVLRPLKLHAQLLSRTLLDMLLSPTSDYCILPHLQLLHSYLLVTSGALQEQLQKTLFDTKSPPNQLSNHTFIGLSPELTVDGSWPPAGANLAFILRRVLVDALMNEYHPNQSLYHQLPEAEWRLGFAIRHLDSDIADNIDPNSKLVILSMLSPYSIFLNLYQNKIAIQALDFLYLDYQPPKPFDTILSAFMLSRYHRVFTLNLRLLRVKHALSYSFQLLKWNKSFMSTISFKLASKFQFMAETFINSLSSYIYSYAIDYTYHHFLHSIDSSSNFSSFISFYTDALDKMLTACFLHSRQKQVQYFFEQIFNLILNFGSLLLNSHLTSITLQSFLEELNKVMKNLISTLKVKDTSQTFENYHFVLLSFIDSTDYYKDI
ncbi:hypothetical protein K474DRAFT_1655722 [Panus rudis PR-1116 ss-1]|nr:hypothetical protein K474DRAFT_1655722 [Panus rudis PR-1116 ss-1]